MAAMALGIRKYRETDTAQLAALFFDSVRQGTAAHYDRQQREAWAPAVPDVGKWRARLSAMLVFVAEDESGIVGFMTLDESGYIDLAFVRADRIGTGVGSKLYERIEHASRQRGQLTLSSNASKLARPFFEKHGWVVKARQSVEQNGVCLTNYRMEKQLT